MSASLKRMHVLLRVMRIALPALSIAGLVAMLTLQTPWSYWIYAIALAGSVGMFTNTIAIKMLFHPLEPTPLGRQGVIPRNKDRIAAGMGRAIENNVLNPDQILDYIEQHNLIDQGLDKLDQYAEQYLNKPENRQRLVHKLLVTIDRILPETLERTLNWMVNRGSEFIQRPEVAERVHRVFIKNLEAYLNNAQNRQKIYGIVYTFFKTNLPTFAQFLYEFFEEYQESQSGIRGFILRVATAAMEVNPEKIRSVLEESLEKPENREQMIQFIDEGINRFFLYLEEPEVKERLLHFAQTFMNWMETQGLQRVTPFLNNFIIDYLNKPESWDEISQGMEKFFQYVRERAKAYLQEPRQQENIKLIIRQIVIDLNIKQIIERNLQNLPMERFEQVVMQTSGEHLAWLEILGGILGAIAGLSFIRWELIFVLPVLLATVVGLEKLLALLHHPFKNKKNAHP